MNDIVKQARDYARNLAGRPEDYLTWQLADEIERLRADADPAVCRMQFPDGSVPGNAREGTEGWKRWADEFQRREREAADEIERLEHEVAQMTTARTVMEAEIERLTVNLGGSIAALKMCNDEIERMRGELEGKISQSYAAELARQVGELEAENEQLRARFVPEIDAAASAGKSE